MDPNTRYLIVWVRDDQKTRGVMCPGPFTHAEACVVLRKITAYSWRRVLLEEIV
jgi:hypothetical protein